MTHKIIARDIHSTQDAKDISYNYRKQRLNSDDNYRKQESLKRKIRKNRLKNKEDNSRILQEEFLRNRK